jgi:hypothetical protein
VILASVTHDVRSNTLEAHWLSEVLNDESAVVEYKSARRHNYSPEQKAEFLAEVEGGKKYTDMAGW